MNKRVKLVEIGPRDGFQNVKEYIPLDTKLKIIDGLIESGYKKIQITSFVSPKAIPQMKDAKEVAAYCLEKYPDLDLLALVPNLYGARTANELGMKEISPVLSLSESHNKANINRTVQESIDGIQEIIETFPNMIVTVDIATAFACPFEGEMELDQLLDLVRRLKEVGASSFTICDTIGMAYPKQIKRTFEALLREYPNDKFGAHIHDTRNMGILNTYEAIRSGADSVQSSIGGLGGCPFAPGASGNTSSEDLVYALNKDGYDTGINFDKLLEVAKYARENIDGSFSGHHLNINGECD